MYKHFTPGPCAAQGGTSVRKCWKLWKSWKCWKLLIVGLAFSWKAVTPFQRLKKVKFTLLAGENKNTKYKKIHFCSRRGHDATITWPGHHQPEVRRWGSSSSWCIGTRLPTSKRRHQGRLRCTRSLPPLSRETTSSVSTSPLRLGQEGSSTPRTRMFSPNFATASG